MRDAPVPSMPLAICCAIVDNGKEPVWHVPVPAPAETDALVQVAEMADTGMLLHEVKVAAAAVTLTVQVFAFEPLLLFAVTVAAGRLIVTRSGSVAEKLSVLGEATNELILAKTGPLLELAKTFTIFLGGSPGCNDDAHVITMSNVDTALRI